MTQKQLALARYDTEHYYSVLHSFLNMMMTPDPPLFCVFPSGSADASGQQGVAGEQSGGGGDSPPAGTRAARVLFDYDAADASELSLYADQVRTGTPP